MLLPKCILWPFSILLLQIYCISFRATVIGTFSVLWSISLCSSYKMLVCFSFSSSSVIIFVLFWWISYGFFVCSVSLDIMIFFRFLTLGFFSTIRPYLISCHGVSQSVYQRANGKWSFVAMRALELFTWLLSDSFKTKCWPKNKLKKKTKQFCKHFHIHKMLLFSDSLKRLTSLFFIGLYFRRRVARQ